MVALMMVVVMVVVVWNCRFPFFVGVLTICFLLSYFCEVFWLLYKFCTEVLRRFLRLVVHERSFVVRARWFVVLVS
jgi:hypothetical protein